jgi:hypothetical protein
MSEHVFRQIVLLPQDREIIAILDCTEAEYREFLKQCSKRSDIRPGDPVAVIDPFTISLIFFVVGVIINLAVAFLFRPRAPRAGAEIRQNSLPGQNVVGRAEYAPKAGFDSLQNVVELGSIIPLVYTCRETINGITYGGVRVNTNLVWSQMLSQGGGQMLRAVFLISEGTLVEVDPSQFAFGDNVLGGYDLSAANASSSRATFYVSKDGGRLTSGDRVAGRSAANDPGNAQNAGGLDVFQVIGLNGTWTSDFCYASKPSTQTKFGVYQLIGNGLAFRVNPSLRAAVIVKTEPSGKTDTRIRCNPDGVAQAQRDKYNTLFPSRAGVTEKNGVGVSGLTTFAVNDSITYILDSSSNANTVFVGVQEGPDHEETCRDVAQTVSGRQRTWDDALVIGELYKFGSALFICEARSPDDEVFASEIDQEPIGGGQSIAVGLRCVRAGVAVVNGTNGTTTATNSSHLFKAAIASFAIPRSAQMLELGLRSTLGVRISGICNFRDSLSQSEIDGRACVYYDGRTYAPGQSLELSNYQSGSYSGAEMRYSFFRIGYRIAGSDQDYTYISQCFGTRSLTQQSVYNFIRLQMPSVQRWEFRIEPLTGWEIRASVATGSLEILDSRITGYRTVSSGSGNEVVTIYFSGEPVARNPETFAIAATRDKGLGVALSDDSDYADTWGKLAESFVFEEIQSSARSPEHEVVYVNILSGNPQTPNYDNIALVGVNLRSNTEFSQLNQLSVYVNKGINAIHTFPEVLFDLLTSNRYGVGSVLSSEQIDTDSIVECAQWTRGRRYFFDGAIAQPVNLRQWGSQTAGYFLLDFVVKNGKFALQPSVYFNQPEPITNLYTAGNIIEDSFEFAYVDSDQRTPNRISVKWRQEKASSDVGAKGLFPVIREVTVRESSTPQDAPLEAIDLTDFCTSETHAIDVAKYLCRGRRLVTHSVRFKTVPTQAALEVGRCFKLGLETVTYDQPRNGAIGPDGAITTTEPLDDGTYTVLIWRGISGSGIEETQLQVQNQKAIGVASAVFCVKESSVETRAYKVQSLGFDEDGNIQVEAAYFPLTENGYSRIVDGWDVSDNWIIEGAISTSENDGATVSSFTGVSIIGPSTATVATANSFTALISGGAGTYTYSWTGSGVTFGSPSSATTTVTATSAGAKTITCTVTRGASSISASKVITAIQSTTVTTIGTVTITGSSTAVVAVAGGYTVNYTSKPAAVIAGSFVIGRTYQIVSLGSTNFTSIGASSNTVGVVFTATGVGTGSGTADSLSAAFISWSWSSNTVNASASIVNSNAPKMLITFDTAGTYTISCTISSPSASDSPQTQTKVVTVT